MNATISYQVKNIHFLKIQQTLKFISSLRLMEILNKQSHNNGH